MINAISKGRAGHGHLAACISIGLFLCANLWPRLNLVWHYNNAAKALVAIAFIAALLTALFPKWLKWIFFAFGLSFFLFGFHSSSIHGQVFELLLNAISLALLAIVLRENPVQAANKNLSLLILLYIALSLFSLLLLPLGSTFVSARLWGFSSFSSQVVSSGAESHLYPLAGVNRLMLFFSFIYLLSALKGSREAYISLCKGILSGAVCSVIAGLLDYYGAFDLGWFRNLDIMQNPNGIQFRLQSTFGHPGWFAEFVTVTIPFILLGFFRRDRSVAWKSLLFIVLILAEIALILAKARAGWIAYPLTLVFCWAFFYLFEGGRDHGRLNITKRGVVKVLISIPLTIGLSLVIIFKLLGDASVSVEEANDAIHKSRPLQRQYVHLGSLEHRAQNIFKTSDRTGIWMKGVNLGREKPLFGMGYESFCWHDGVLRKVPASHLMQHPSGRQIVATAHNLYVQLFVSGGFAGLFLWLLAVGYACRLLVMDLTQNRAYFNLCVLLSIVSFHIYGFFQSMQYIPVVWFMIFICLGYALTIVEEPPRHRMKRLTDVLVAALCVLVLAGGWVYFMDRGSQGLAAKYGLKVYAADQDWHNYLGFHNAENHWRWSGKRSLMRIHGNGLVEIQFICDTPGVEREPVSVDIHVDGEPAEGVVFRQAGRLNWQYRLNQSPSSVHELHMEVSRTWNPKRAGISSDGRDLGVLVSEPVFLRTDS